MKSTTPDHLTFQETAVHGTGKRRSKYDPLLLSILGTAIVLAVLVVGIAVFWGSGPVLAEIPWYIPLISAFNALTTLCVAYLALGRYQVLRDPISYWVGMGFAAYGIGQIFYALTWPGLLPGGGAILGRFSNTPAVIAVVDLTLLDGFLLAAVLVRGPGKQSLAGWRWLWSVAAWLCFASVIFGLLILFEPYLPLFAGRDGRFTALQQSWVTVQLFFYAAGSILSTLYYRRYRDRLAGYIAFPQMALVFIHMMVLIGGKRYDLWWYTQRVVLVTGYLIVLLGLLSEYVRLLRRENEGRLMLEAIMENIPVGLAVTGGPPNFPLARVSRYGLEMNQRPADGLIGSPSGQHQTAWRIFLPDGVTQPLPDHMPLYRASRFGEETRNFEMVMEAQDGRKFPVLVNAAPIRDGRGQIVAAINTWLDISERKKAEEELHKNSEALRESEFRYRQLADAMPQLVWTALPDGTVDYYNIRTHEFNGITQVNNGEWHWSPVLHSEDVQRTAEAWQQSVETGEVYQIEHRVQMADGTYRWHLSRGVPARDEAGQVSRWFGTATDIHDQKQAEEQLRFYAEKLKASNRELQSFAYVASHDLQEPLRKIESFGDLLLDSPDNLDERHREYLARMRNAAGRMRGMVDGLLELSRVNTQSRAFVRVDLSRVAAEVLSDLEHQVRRTDGRVEVGELPEVEGDPLQLHQLLQNLIGNALKYNHPDRPPVVRVHARRLPASVQILVEDNGIGFDPSEVERIFKPFHRLVGRSEYEGSGMGLAICWRIVERHGGEITASSEPGQGSVFIVTLPISHQNDPRNSIGEETDDGNHAVPSST